MRSPEVTAGGRGSKGTVLRLTVMPHSCSRSSACWPSSWDFTRSTSTRCTSVPPVNRSIPAALQSGAPKRSAKIWAPFKTRCIRSLNSGVPAIFSATAFAATTCISGPPCWPGNTAEFSFLPKASASRDSIIPERGPPMVLWIVVEVTSE